MALPGDEINHSDGYEDSDANNAYGDGDGDDEALRQLLSGVESVLSEADYTWSPIGVAKTASAKGRPSS